MYTKATPWSVIPMKVAASFSTGDTAVFGQDFFYRDHFNFLNSKESYLENPSVDLNELHDRKDALKEV